MYRYPLFFITLVMSVCMSFGAPETGKPLRVVLKLDDTRAVDGRWPQQWQRVDAFCVERGIPYTIGVICKSLEGNNPEFITSLRALASSGRVELWNHGYDHKQWTDNGTKVAEFKGSGYAFQLEHLRKAQTLAKTKLGVTLTAFGAPFNATDDDTVKALAEFPEFKVWIFGPAGVKTSLFVAGRSVNIEQPTSKPNFAAFKQGYAKHKNDPFLVMQGHPMAWDDALFAEFVRIVDFLQAEGVTFVLPRDLPQ